MVIMNGINILRGMDKVLCQLKRKPTAVLLGAFILMTMLVVHSTMRNGGDSDPSPIWLKTTPALKKITPLVMNPETFSEKPEVQKYFRWPTPLHPKSLDDVTDAKQSSYVIEARDNVYPNKFRAGTTIKVIITARDKRGTQKQFGGDFFKVKLMSSHTKSSVSAVIEDHDNGMYSAYIPLYFSGDAILSVVLIHPSEAVDILRRVTSSKMSPGLVYKGVFQEGMSVEERECGLWLPGLDEILAKTGKIDDRNKFCNFTHEATGEPWYCEKPQYLDCKSIDHFRIARNADATAILVKSNMFQKGVNADVQLGQEKQIFIMGAGELIKDKVYPQCTAAEAPFPPRPSGYFSNGKWTSTQCKARNFDSSQQAECLKNKLVYFFGDSTIRQWYSYYVPFGKVNLLQKVWSQVGHFIGFSKGVLPWEHVDYENLWEPREGRDPYANISIRFSAHGPPLQNGGSPYTQPYIADRIDQVKGSKDTVIAFTIGAHWLLYDPVVFIRRLRTIQKAIERLKKRSPETLVVYKGFNNFDMYDFDYNQCCLSQFLSFRLDSIARKMFKETKGVVFLDAWDMTNAHWSVASGLHPQNEIIDSEISLFLSYVCPL